jgi:lysophospholipase L1-like esterase
LDILILGNSDTQGRFVDGPTWSGVLQSLLAADLDEPVTVTEVGFSAVSTSGAAYAERKVRELRPDLVVLPLGTFAFTVGFSWKRIESLFGKRIGARYRRTEEAFDRRTREPGNEPRRLNRLVRKTIRRAIGTRPLISQAELTRNYADIIRAVSRVEDVDLLLVAYPAEQGKHVSIRNIERRRAEFLREVGIEARQRHYRLLDSALLFDSAPPGDDLLTADGFHQQRRGHELLGRAVAEAVKCRRTDAGILSK